MSNAKCTLYAKITEWIGSELLDLIPEDEWQTIVDVEVDFFKKVTGPKLIREYLKAQYELELVKHIEELSATDEWNDFTEQYISSKLKELLKASGGESLAFSTKSSHATGND